MASDAVSEGYGATVRVTMVRTEAGLRAFVAMMIEKGVSQRYIAEKILDVSESWLSRWLHPEKINPKTNKPYNVRPITVPQMNRLDQYAADFASRLTQGEETQRDATDASTAGRLQRTNDKAGGSSSH